MEEDEGGRIDGRECGDDTQSRTNYGGRNRKQTVAEQQKQQE